MPALSTPLHIAWLIASVGSATASDFLSQREHVTIESIEQKFFEGLLEVSDSPRLSEIRRELHPMYVSLPKNEQGQVAPSTVRYALHRYFVHKHGWYVKGFSSSGSGSTNSSSAAMVTELAPAYIQGLLERQLRHEGMQLHDMVVFAATMSDLIFEEGVRNLHAMYDVLGVSRSGSIETEDFNFALRGYLSTLIVGFNAAVTDRASIITLEVEAREVYPQYDDLLLWLEDTRLTLNFKEEHRGNPFVENHGVGVEQADLMMHELYHKFGSLNKLECVEQKANMLDQEYPGTGRVPLATFYADTKNPLRESVDYLRNQGALDETTPQSPTVMMPNYLSSPSHCMPFSSYFAVCCPDECESVLGGIEIAVADSSAEPRRIAAAVSAQPSETEVAPRNLSSTLLSRLDDIASHHGGSVPLHGRLFMQWLHFAYPHECPYPHVTGTVNPVTQDEWLATNTHLQSVVASEEEMSHHLNAFVERNSSSLTVMPWVDVEELVAIHRTSSPRSGPFRMVMMVVAVLSFALPLISASRAVFSRQPADDDKSHFV